MTRPRYWRAVGWLLLFICAGSGLAIFAAAIALGPHHKSATARRPLPSAGDAAAQALSRGRALLQSGQPRLAIRAVSTVREGALEEPEALTIRGLALASLEDVGPARLVLERAWKLRPNAMAAKVLAAIYLGANETDRGLQMLHAAARLVPGDFRPWYAMADCVFMRRRRYEDAAAAFREALKRNPAHRESQIGLVAALLKAHHVDEALAPLQTLLHERPDDPSILFHAAALALESDRRAEGARYLERVLALDPAHREALLLAARIDLGDHRPRQALAQVERAVALGPDDLDALNLLGSIQTALGLKDQAAQTLNRRREVERRTALLDDLTLKIRQSPADPELRWRLGDAAALSGMKPLALQSYQAALALAPACQQARAGLRKLEASGEVPGAVAARLAGLTIGPSP